MNIFVELYINIETFTVSSLGAVDQLLDRLNKPMYIGKNASSAEFKKCKQVWYLSTED